MKDLAIEAKTENLGAVLAFVDGQLEKWNCPVKAQMQIDLAVEELFVNIAKYAYDPEVGEAMVRVGVCEDPPTVTVTLIDRGRPFDPLDRADPDVTLSAEARQIGGLGIYMAKKAMDGIAYEYKDGQNILTIRKKIL